MFVKLACKTKLSFSNSFSLIKADWYKNKRENKQTNKRNKKKQVRTLINS